MAEPACNLNFDTLLPELPFQVSIISDTAPPISKIIYPPDFTPDSNFLAFETTVVDDVSTHNVSFLNTTSDTKLMRVRNIAEVPGAWSDTIITNVQVAADNTVPFAVEIIPSHTAFSMDTRWQLEDSDGNIYGPYIGILDNIKNFPAGEYTLTIKDLDGNIITEDQISTDYVSAEVFVDVGFGTSTVTFTIPEGLDVDDFKYYLISDFGDTSLSNNYDSVKYDLENGLYYLVVMYRNVMLEKNDPDLDVSIYIDTNIDKIVTVSITDDLKIESVTEGTV